MNHAQACAPMQKEAAMQAVYQFLHEQGFADVADNLVERSSIPYQPEALEKSPATLLTALTHYENQRQMAFQVKKPDAEFLKIQTWLTTLKEHPELYTSYEHRNLQTHMANVICCKFQPKQNSPIYAAGSADKSIAICSAEANNVLRRINATGPVLSLHFNPVHPHLLLATCMNGGHSLINIDQPEGQEVLHHLIDHKKFVVTGRWSPDGQHYATGSHDGTVHIYGPGASANQWKLLGQLEYPNNVESVEWIDTNNLYVAVREDNYLHQIQLPACKEVAKFNLNEFGDDHVSFNVLDMAVSPDRKSILLATDHHRVILLQVGSSHHIRNFYNLLNDGYSTPRLAWSPIGKYGYVTCQDKSIGVLDIASGQTVHKIVGHEINVRDVGMHPFTNQLVSCSFDKSCRVWKTEIE